MQAAKQVVSEFLGSGNKHSVDIEQETKPAILHEKVLEKQHEDVIHAVDREVHQHHHQVHVQPIQDKVLEKEQHHSNVVPVEHRHRHHGKDREIETALATEHGKFKNEREVLPVESSSSSNVVVGEHVHHHVHDYVQPVIERERVIPHVVHTTVPIHERIEHEPYLHKGNVLPMMTMDEFTQKGYSLKGNKKPVEHIEYQGDPLDIDNKSRVGFNKSHHTGTMEGAGAGMLAGGMMGSSTQRTGMMEGGQKTGMMEGTQQTGMMESSQSGMTRDKHHTGAMAGGAAAVGAAGAAGLAAEKAYTHDSKTKGGLLNRRGSTSSLSSSDEEKSGAVPRSMSKKERKKSTGKHSWLDKLNPRVDTSSKTETNV